MTEKNQREELLAQLSSMDKSTLVKKVAKKMALASETIAKKNQEIESKDALISSLSLKKEQSEQIAKSIISEAQKRAEQITQDTFARAEESEKKARQKLENANAEAESIVEAKLIGVKDEITKLENRRATEKAKTIMLYNGLLQQTDALLESLSVPIQHLYSFKTLIGEHIAQVEAEAFDKFEITDYVTPHKKTPDFIAEPVPLPHEIVQDATPQFNQNMPVTIPEPIVPINMPITEAIPIQKESNDDFDFDMLSQLLDDNDAPVKQEPYAEQNNNIINNQQPADSYYQPVLPVTEQTPVNTNSEELSFDDFDIFGDNNVQPVEPQKENSGQSFTDTFMKIDELPNPAVNEPVVDNVFDQDYLDLGDFAGLLDDDEEDTRTENQPDTNVVVPKKEKKPSSRWLS